MTTLTFERAALHAALQTLQRIVDRATTLPILTHVLIEARERGATLTATDLEKHGIVRVGADADLVPDDPAGIAVPCGRLADIVRHIEDGAQVSLSWSAAAPMLTLRSGRARYSLPVRPVEDFPPAEPEDLPVQFTMLAGELAHLLEATSYAMSTDKSRAYLQGVHLHARDTGEGWRLCAVASDGHRMPVAEADLPAGAETMPGIIVPAKAVAEMERLLGGARAADAEIALSDRKIRVAVGPTTLVSKLIDSRYPDYVPMVAATQPHVLLVDRAAMIRATEKVIAITDTGSRAVCFRLEGERVTLSLRTPGEGEAQDEVAGEFDGGDEMTVTVNGRYVIDVLGHLPGEMVRWRIDTPSAPLIVEPAEAGRVKALLLPLRPSGPPA